MNTEEWVETLEQAVTALLVNRLDEPSRRQAERTAHLPTASLETFEMHQGALLAHEIEQQLRPGVGIAQGLHLSEQVLALGRLVAERKGGADSDAALPQSIPPRAWLLVVDRDAEFAVQLSEVATTRGLAVDVLSEPTEVAAFLDEHPPDLALIDLPTVGLDEGDLSVLESLIEHAPPIPFLAFATEDRLAQRVQVVRLGAQGFLHKPSTPERVLDIALRVLQRTHVGHAMGPPDRAEIEQRIVAIEAEANGPPVARPEPALTDRDYLKLGIGRYDYSRGIENERYGQLELSRALGERTLVGRVERIDRFGIRDVLLTGEFYSPLWADAWGYLSLEAGIDAEIVPRWAVGGELFQGLGGFDPALSAVELSLGYRHVRFRTESVDIVVPGVTFYLPRDVWLTGKFYYVPDTNARTWSTEINWQPTPRLRLQAGWSTGTAAERLQTTADILRIDTETFTVGATMPLTDQWSLDVSAIREDRRNSYRRRGAVVNLMVHW